MGNELCLCNRKTPKNIEFDLNCDRSEDNSKNEMIQLAKGGANHDNLNKKINNDDNVLHSQLIDEVRQKMSLHDKNYTEISIEEFESKINDVVKQTYKKLETNIEEFRKNAKNTPSDQNKNNDSNIHQLVKLSPVKYDNNQYYFGEWNINGKQSGMGGHINSDGAIYHGSFNNGLYDGYGVYIKTNGEYYLGQWKNNSADGKGTLVGHAAKYDGMWVNNVREGEGEETYSNKSIYKGEFSKNIKKGNGLFVWPNNSYYKGLFENDMFNGYGEMRWEDGRYYKGEWKDNKINGKGEFVWPDESYYKGEYINDNKHGAGVFYWNKNKYYEGIWVNNKQHGEGCVNIKNKKYNATWRLGKLIRVIDSNYNTNFEEKIETLYFTPQDTISLSNNDVNKGEKKGSLVAKPVGIQIK